MDEGYHRACRLLNFLTVPAGSVVAFFDSVENVLVVWLNKIDIPDSKKIEKFEDFPVIYRKLVSNIKIY